MVSENEWRAKTSMRLATKIAPMLHGKGREVQCAVLADLIARWVCGHHPDQREVALGQLIFVVEQILPTTDLELYGPNGFPTGGVS